MNRERLRILADHLPSVPRKHFLMASWAVTPGSGRKKKLLKDGYIAEVECGTAACAAGWACSIPTLREAGLRITGKGIFGETVVQYHDLKGFEALAEFFDISIYQSRILFSPSHYDQDPGPDVVTARIRELLRDDL